MFYYECILETIETYVFCESIHRFFCYMQILSGVPFIQSSGYVIGIVIGYGIGIGIGYEL